MEESRADEMRGSSMSSESRQLVSDYSLLLSSLEFLLSITVGALILVWFYRAIKRIEESLREVRERLGLTQKGANQPGSNPEPPSPRKAREMARISNVWGIPAILFIFGAFAGAPLLGSTLTIDVFEVAGLMALVAAAWEVIRREI